MIEPGEASRERLDAVAAAFAANAEIYGAKGSPLYAALCIESSADPDIVALAARAQPRAQPALHLFGAVHFLLMQHRDDPLAAYFGTLTEPSKPAGSAFGPFKRFCATHCKEIAEILAARTVQTTYVERCGGLLPCLSYVAELAGEPLDLVEIGCSAGILLTVDQYRYALADGSHVGADDAPLTLNCTVHDAPPGRGVRVPRIGTRIGIDLHPVDARSPAGRDWILALSFPELREAHARLAAALETVARSDLTLIEGDALERLPEAIAMTDGPLCVFHSACLYYWSEDARHALDALLVQEGRHREIYRLGIELPESYRLWANGAGGSGAGRPADPDCEVTLSHYAGGAMASRLIGYVRSNEGSMRWLV